MFAYLCHVPAERWGFDWLAGGSIRARFASPVYDGDEVVVTSEADGEGRLVLTLCGPDGAECATAVASLGAAAR